MSDNASSEPFADPGALRGMSAGQILRRAREADGMHIAVLAVQLKVPTKKLEALEADRYDELPDMVFVRALAASMCRTLKIDPQPVMQGLPTTVAPHLGVETRAINEPYKVPGERKPPSDLPEKLKNPYVIAVAVLLLGALALAFAPPFTFFAGKSDEKSGPALANTDKVAIDSVASTASSAALPTAGVSDASAGLAPTLPAQTEVAAVAGANSPELGASAAAVPGEFHITAANSSWLEVRDATGAVRVRKLLAAGESYDTSGGFPLKVVIGRVSGTVVTVRGQNFDLTPFDKNQVAHIEVE